MRGYMNWGPCNFVFSLAYSKWEQLLCPSHPLGCTNSLNEHWYSWRHGTGAGPNGKGRLAVLAVEVWHECFGHTCLLTINTPARTHPHPGLSNCPWCEPISNILSCLNTAGHLLSGELSSFQDWFYRWAETRILPLSLCCGRLCP